MQKDATEDQCPFDIFISTYNMMQQSAVECTADLAGVPGVITIMHCTHLNHKYKHCAADVRTYLVECEAFMNFTRKMGGYIGVPSQSNRSLLVSPNLCEDDVEL